MKRSHASFASIKMNVTLGQVGLLLLLQHGITSSANGRQSDPMLALPPDLDFASIVTLGQVALFPSTLAWDRFICHWWTKRSHTGFASGFGFCLNHNSRSGGTFSFFSSMGLLHPPLTDKAIPCWLCLQIRILPQSQL